MTEPTNNQNIAQALRKCDWSNVPIGNKAILQAACEALEKLSAATEQEAVAEIVEVGNGFIAAHLIRGPIAVTPGQPKVDAKLYTQRADDGEVERLRAKNAALKIGSRNTFKKMCDLALVQRDAHAKRADAAEQKLAEAQALLREWGDMFHGEGVSAGPLMILRQKNARFLSTTAQPADGVKS